MLLWIVIQLLVKEPLKHFTHNGEYDTDLKLLMSTLPPPFALDLHLLTSILKEFIHFQGCG